jgi:hypothetical protein
MSWATVEAAIIAAVKHASGVEQVRLLTEERKQDRKQRIELSFEFEPIDDPEDLTSDVSGGLDLGQIPEVRILVRMEAVSYTHAPDASAYAIAYRMSRRYGLADTRAILTAAGLVLERAERAVPIAREADQRQLSATGLAWSLRIREDEIEGSAPDGSAPRDYFNKVELQDDGTPLAQVAVAEDIAPATVLAAADWRTLWLGGSTDLVRGRTLVDIVGGALHDQAATIGDETLTAATVLPTDTASLRGNERDAGVLADELALVLILSAPAAAGRALSKTSDDSDGWLLTTEADGSLELSAPAAGAVLTTDPGLLDGATWLLVAVSCDGTDIALHVHGEAPLSAACTYAQSYADAALVLGAFGAVPGASGQEIALVGEARTSDPAALLMTLAAAVGL